MEHPQDHQALYAQVRAGLSDANAEAWRAVRESTAPALAPVLLLLSVEEQVQVLKQLPSVHAAEGLKVLPESAQERLLAALPIELLSACCSHLPPDDIAALLTLAHPQTRQSALRSLPPDLGQATELLLHCPEGTAGRLMNTEVVSVRNNMRVAEALQAIREYMVHTHSKEFFFVYVVDAQGVLVGEIPVWSLLIAVPEASIRSVMQNPEVRVLTTVVQEEVSRLVRDHDRVSLPVVDSRSRLVGRITVDDVVDVIDHEHEEDLAAISGTGRERVQELSLWQTFRMRTGWLFAALVGEFGVAAILGTQENFFAQVPQVAFFIPLIMAIGGNASIQASSLVIRGLATNEVRGDNFFQRLLREFCTSTLLGIVFALLLVAGGTALTGRWDIGITIGLATLCNVILGTCSGTTIPVLIRALHFDPALAAGPLLSTLNDFLSIVIYLVLALLLLQAF